MKRARNNREASPAVRALAEAAVMQVLREKFWEEMEKAQKERPLGEPAHTRKRRVKPTANPNTPFCVKVDDDGRLRCDVVLARKFRGKVVEVTVTLPTDAENCDESNQERRGNGCA